MRIIISPAKQMRTDTDTIACTEMPVFLEKTAILKDWISSLSFDEQKKLWACNDKIAKQNAARFAGMDLKSSLTPALLAYDGIQYTYMAPAVFEDGQITYVQEHLRILSGFYGVLKPMDGVVPYRLEMQAKAAVAGCRKLYEFWGDDLYKEVMDDSRILINLASKEYAKCVEKYLQPDGRPLYHLRFRRTRERKGRSEGRICQDGQRRDGALYGRDSGGETGADQEF